MKRTKTKKILLLLSAFVFAFSTFSMNIMAEEIAPQETEATIEFQAGNLTLGSVPSFDFGSHPVLAATESYAPSTTGNQGTLTVSDLRGSGAGWRLNATLSGFKNAGNASLAGAQLVLATPTISGAVGTAATAPISAASIQLSSDGTSVAIQNASAGTGQGVWNTKWAAPTLEVPAGNAKVGTNTATIEWNLSDAP